MWVAVAIYAVSVDSSRRARVTNRTTEHENIREDIQQTREVIVGKVDGVQRTLDKMRADDVEHLARAAERHIEVLTKVSSTTEQFGVSLHSASHWAKECELVLPGGPKPPRAMEGSRVIIDYYGERVAALRGAVARR